MRSDRGLTQYLVERYLPGITRAEVAAMARRASKSAELMAAEGMPVRHLGSTFLPADEAMFSLFTAPSPEAVRAANERAGAPFARILEVVRLPGVRAARGEVRRCSAARPGQASGPREEAT